MKGAANVKYTPENRHGSMERTASPEINPQASGQLIHDKEHKGEKTVSSISGAGRAGQLRDNKGN